MPVTKKPVNVDAFGPGSEGWSDTRKVRGGGTTPRVPTPAYSYDEVSVTPIEGDSDYSKTLAEVLTSLGIAKDNRKIVKFLVKGYNFYAKHDANPKGDAKENAAMRTLAQSLGISVADFQAMIAARKAKG